MRREKWNQGAKLSAALALLAAVGAPSAKATLLSQIIASGQPIQSGGVVFSNFAVTSLSALTASQIDVVPAVDANGNFGLSFSTSALVIAGGGNLVADVTFTAAGAVPG